MQIAICFFIYYFWSIQSVAGIVFSVLLACCYCFIRLYELYIAVMALRDRRDEASLSILDQSLGRIIVIRGILYDIAVNTLMSIVLLELPRWHRGELLLTPRMLRLAALPADSAGLHKYRRSLCRWLLSQIDQHDKSGGHNVPLQK